jgi:hypothetical protein
MIDNEANEALTSYIPQESMRSSYLSSKMDVATAY